MLIHQILQVCDGQSAMKKKTPKSYNVTKTKTKIAKNKLLHRIAY